MATWAWPLPAELTGAVFQFLSPHELLGAASLVCKFWQRCALEPLSWRALDVNATLAAMVAQSRLQRIAVGPAANSLVQDFVTALLKRPRRVSGLRSISFARATSSSYDLGDAALAALLIRAPQLRSLALASCSHLTDRGLAPLAALARPLPPPPLREQWAALRDGDAAVQLLRGTWRESGGAVEVEVVTEDESEYKRARAVAGGDRKEGEEDKAQGFAALRAKCPDLADAEKELAPLHFRAVCTAPWRPDDAAAPAPLLRFAACPRLQSVSLARCTQLTSKALELLAAGCPDLRSVDLTSVFQVDFAGVAALARGCRSLERLVLNGCRRVDAQCVACLAENLPALKALYLGACVLVDDEALRHVATLAQLEELQLSQCALVTDEGVQRVAHGCSRLRKVMVGGAPALSDASVCVLVERLPRLAELHCSGLPLGGPACDAIATGRAPLQVLVASRCHLDDEAVRRMAPGLRALHSLELSKNDVGDAGFEAIALAAPQLRTVSAALSDLTTRGALALCAHCPQLRVLNLTGCGIDDEAMAALGRLSQLRNLNLSLCSRVSDAGLVEFARAAVATAMRHWQRGSELPPLAPLQSLSLYWLSRVTDKGLCAVARAAPTLATINATGCAVTDAGCVELASLCRDLAVFNASATLVSRAGLDALKQHCPQLSAVRVGDPNAAKVIAAARQGRRAAEAQEHKCVVC